MREVLDTTISAGTALVVVWLGWKWNAHRTWVLDNKKLEWRELIDAAGEALRGMGDAVYQKAEYPSKSVPQVFTILKNRIFIADTVVAEKLLDRWHQIVRHVNNVTLPEWNPKEESILGFQRESQVFSDLLIVLSRKDLRIPSVSKSSVRENLKEGTRRLALLLGVAGAILGGLISYAKVQSVLSQRTQHVSFEQLANSDAVRQERNWHLEQFAPTFQGPDGRTYRFPDGTDEATAIAYFKKWGIAGPSTVQPLPGGVSASPESRDQSAAAELTQGTETDPIAEFAALPQERQLTTLKELPSANQDRLLAAVKARRKDGIRAIHWTGDKGVESIETTDGRTLYPTPMPGGWTYLVIALCPFLGFSISWGLVRAVGWVGAGFLASPT